MVESRMALVDGYAKQPDKYAALDEETKEFFTHMFVGSMPAAKIKNKVLALIAKGVLKHEVLSLMTGNKQTVPELVS